MQRLGGLPPARWSGNEEANSPNHSWPAQAEPASMAWWSEKH